MSRRVRCSNGKRAGFINAKIIRCFYITSDKSGQPHQNSIQNMFCNRFVKIVLKKMCYLGNKADIADSKTLTMKNNLSDWIFYVSILQPKSFDYDS